MPSCTTRNGLRVCSRPRSGNDLIITVEDARGRDVGEALLDARTLRGRPVLRITAIDVIESARHQGVGTAMYEEALALACARGERLVSDFTRSEYAEAFWRKQRRKGRAVCIQPNPKGSFSINYFGGTLARQESLIEEECHEAHMDARMAQKCTRARVKELLRGLPRPRYKPVSPVSGYAGLYWPCGAYGVKVSHCKDGSLKGLRGYP